MTDQMTPLVHVMAQLVQPRPGHRLVFAFDQLMAEDRIRELCPNPRFVTTARLLSRRFITNADGVITVMPCRGSVVHGVVWEISESEQIDLETHLGVPGAIDRFGAFARGPDEELITVEYYASRNHRHGVADPLDLMHLQAIGQKRGFPVSYLTELLRWAPPPVEFEGLRPVQ